MARIEGKELEEARRVIRAAYYQSVVSDALDLVRAYYDGEFDDEEGLTERLDNDADSHVTYTADQWTTLYASDSVGDGMARAEDLGATSPAESRSGRREGIDQDQLVAIWAYGAYQGDVRETLTNSYGVPAEVMAEPMDQGLDATDRLVWLVGTHSKHYLGPTDDGAGYVFLVGTLGKPGEVAEGFTLGIVALSNGAKGELIADRLTTYSFLEHRVGATELLKATRRSDEEGPWAVLSDWLLEQGMISRPVHDEDELAIALAVAPAESEPMFTIEGENLPLSEVLKRLVASGGIDAYEIAEMLSLEHGGMTESGIRRTK